jgi:signal transduction histidine kinase
LRVDDDGDGIDAEALPRIFEPHFSTRTSGSGLGLAISRRLVEAWGGAITAESARGVGTTMRITLRATTPAPAGAGAPDGDAALGRRDGAG